MVVGRHWGAAALEKMTALQYLPMQVDVLLRVVGNFKELTYLQTLPLGEICPNIPIAVNLSGPRLRFGRGRWSMAIEELSGILHEQCGTRLAQSTGSRKR